MRLYDRWVDIDQLPELLISRLERLSCSSVSGLTSELFLTIPGLPDLTLGPDSLFTDTRANQAEVFAAIAAALQNLRSSECSPDRPPLGPRRFPVSTVLNHKDYLCSKWTDSILRATFLRGASIDELTYADPNSEDQKTQALVDLVTQSSDGEHDIALEIVLACNLGKCRIKIDDQITSILHKFGAGEVASYMLKRLDETGR
jgi:hypothetical protein